MELASSGTVKKTMYPSGTLASAAASIWTRIVRVWEMVLTMQIPIDKSTLDDHCLHWESSIQKCERFFRFLRFGQKCEGFLILLDIRLFRRKKLAPSRGWEERVCSLTEEASPPRPTCTRTCAESQGAEFNGDHEKSSHPREPLRCQAEKEGSSRRPAAPLRLLLFFVLVDDWRLLLRLVGPAFSLVVRPYRRRCVVGPLFLVACGPRVLPNVHRNQSDLFRSVCASAIMALLGAEVDRAGMTETQGWLQLQEEYCQLPRLARRRQSRVREPTPPPPPPLPTSELQCAVLSDSILQSEESAKLNSSWLDIAGQVDVVSGRTLFRHEWVLPRAANKTFLICAGNDFKKGGRVKGSLPWNFCEVVQRRLAEVRARTRQKLTFVLVGDWSKWQGGFSGADAEAGVR